MIRLHHHDDLGMARFVTFSCYHRRPLFTEDDRFRVFLDELAKARQNSGFTLLGYVVMPNHVHIVIHPQGRLTLGTLVGEIKSLTARRIGTLLKLEGRHNREMAEIIRNGENRFVFWQRKCYDHNCRTVESVREKINYCHMNPVRAGLVADAAEWPWSSYRWYMGYDDAVLEIDGVEL